MGKVVWLVLADGFLVLLVTALLFPWRGWMHTVNRDMLYAAPPLALYQGVSLTQTIKPRYPGFYRIDILLGNQPVDTGELTLTIKTDCKVEDVLVKRTVPESALPAISFYPFAFEPLDLPRGQELCLQLSTTAATRNNNLVIGASFGDANSDGEAGYAVPAAGVEVSTSEMPKSAYRLYLPLVQRAPVPAAGQEFDIGYRLYYSSTPINTMDALLKHLVEFKPDIFGSGWFYLLLGGAYLLSLGLFFMLVWRLPRNWPFD